MKKILSIIACAAMIMPVWAQIDMQAHQASDQGQEAYDDYLSRQAAYYTGNYTYERLRAAQGNELFGLLNTLMGNTCLLETGGYSYNSLKSAYVGVDRDLNNNGNIIGYYDGCTLNGTWDNGNTWNREHTWPQSKGANKNISMGHDMQSVRPTSTAVNSDRGNDAYGESYGFYDPNDIAINNVYYQPSNRGSYRGDAARVILYDYIVYGKAGSYQNSLYNGNAQLLEKLGTDGVFESIAILLKWHMQDPPSLTEMVRNDGAEDYQGNRNPFIDFPELAIQVLKNQVTTYNVTVSANVQMAPNYIFTTSAGFVAYLTDQYGIHPDADDLNITGTTAYTYDEQTGRLIVSSTTNNLTISLRDAFSGLDSTEPTAQNAIFDLLGRQVKTMVSGQMYIVAGRKVIAK